MHGVLYSKGDSGDTLQVYRVGLLAGEVAGSMTDLDTASTNRARVAARFSAFDWGFEGDYQVPSSHSCETQLSYSHVSLKLLIEAL